MTDEQMPPCGICGETSTMMFNNVRETEPKQDEHGTWWRTYEVIEGESGQFRCAGHYMQGMKKLVPIDWELA